MREKLDKEIEIEDGGRMRKITNKLNTIDKVDTLRREKKRDTYRFKTRAVLEGKVWSHCCASMRRHHARVESPPYPPRQPPQPSEAHCPR